MYDSDQHARVLWGVASRTLVVLSALTFLIINVGVALHPDEMTAVSAVAPARFGAAQAPIEPPTAAGTAASTTEVLFVGDMFFDRQIRFVSTQKGVDYPFACVDTLLHSADMVVGNLEGPITTNSSVSFGTIPGTPNNFRFTFPTTTATVLLRHNVQVVSLGNNHILNFGTAGLNSTHTFLDQAGVGYFGGVVGSEPIYRVEKNGVKLSLVGYNQFGGTLPREVAATVAAEHAAGRVVVVFAHWGVEYTTDPTNLRPVAQLLAQSGAAAVIGAHPHVVGQSEYIGNTVVYYSLGNFIFDQYFSEAVRHGLTVLLTITSNGVVDAKEYPVELERDGRTCSV